MQSDVNLTPRQVEQSTDYLVVLPDLSIAVSSHEDETDVRIPDDPARRASWRAARIAAHTRRYARYMRQARGRAGRNT